MKHLIILAMVSIASALPVFKILRNEPMDGQQGLDGPSLPESIVAPSDEESPQPESIVAPPGEELPQPEAPLLLPGGPPDGPSPQSGGPSDGQPQSGGLLQPLSPPDLPQPPPPPPGLWSATWDLPYSGAQLGVPPSFLPFGYPFFYPWGLSQFPQSNFQPPLAPWGLSSQTFY